METHSRLRNTPMMQLHTAKARLGLPLVLLWLCVGIANAGPPYQTDDPDPVPYHHWELYAFMMRDQTDGVTTAMEPALELNNGVAPNTQLHLVVPEAYTSQSGVSASGLGDIEAGVKYRFVTETKSRPEVGIFPLAELPTGEQSKGLGNGRAWYKIPVWLQKSWGAWTSYGGGGVALNSEPGQRTYAFGGVLVQRTLSPHITLGGEAFFTGAQVQGGRAGMPQEPGTRESSLWNIGGSYNFTPDFSLLFSAGHSWAGDGNNILYLGLYRTWGPGSP